MQGEIKLKTPLREKDVENLKIGEKVLLTGTIYAARDAAHKRMVEAIKKGEKLPFDPQGQVIYYVGPAPAKPGKAIGPAGPTTSSRMDPYTLPLLEAGIKGMIGKGYRSNEVKEAMKKYRAVYFAATGGAAALLSERIKKQEIVAYDDLGPEALRRLEVEDFPVIVVNDIYGGDLYQEGVARWKVK